MSRQRMLLWYQICPTNLGKCREKSKNWGQDTAISCNLGLTQTCLRWVRFSALVSLLSPIFAHREPQKVKQRGEKRNNRAMVSEMRASTETGDRQSVEQRRAKGKIWKRNTLPLLIHVCVQAWNSAQPSSGHQEFWLPRRHSSAFKHSWPGGHVCIYTSLQKSAPVSQHHLQNLSN